MSQNTNLAVIPTNWSLTYGPDPQIIHLDTVVTHNGHVSIRLDPYLGVGSNNLRECDGTWLKCKPGDHIVVKCWIKTSASSLGDADFRHGGRIGGDLYAHTSVGYGIVDAIGVPLGDNVWPPGSSQIGPVDCIVTWGHDWTLKQWEIIVPNFVYTTVQRGGTKTPCDPIQVDSFVLWLDVRPVADLGQVWFADAELYINPTETPPVQQAGINVAGLILAAGGLGGLLLWWLTRKRRRR
jgi:hypothetical protein